MSRKRKNRVLENITIEAYAAEGKSIARLEDGKVLFVANAIPGDVVNVFVTKNKKSFAEGKIMELLQPSESRVAPFCEHFGVCGGCKWQMLPYEQQLKYKQQQVEDQLKRIGHIELPTIQPILGSPKQQFYRNKLEFTFCTHRYRTHEELAAAGDEIIPQEPALGFHAPGLFDKVVPINQCYLQDEPTNTLLKVLNEYTTEHNLPYYDHRQHTGWLRNIIIRVARTGEVLVNLVMQHERKGERIALLEHILENVPGITSLHYTINSKMNDSLYDQDVKLYKGKGYIEETLEDFKYIISPKSFFQTNTFQAEELYRVTR
ncbi:MAG: class I SAM-dependent RNA methyltransferase, partial [Chitinophagaceae bacterium]|nr:class I SAM-dependent RNA methyltransferase [Chitinophagaceae bacterium]